MWRASPMSYATRHSDALTRIERERSVLKINQELAFNHIEKLVVFFVLVPVVLALDNPYPDGRVVHIAECLVEPRMFDLASNFVEVDDLQRGVFNVKPGFVGEVGHGVSIAGKTFSTEVCEALPSEVNRS